VAEIAAGAAAVHGERAADLNADAAAVGEAARVAETVSARLLALLGAAMADLDVVVLAIARVERGIAADHDVDVAVGTRGRAAPAEEAAAAAMADLREGVERAHAAEHREIAGDGGHIDVAGQRGLTIEVLERAAASVSDLGEGHFSLAGASRARAALQE